MTLLNQTCFYNSSVPQELSKLDLMQVHMKFHFPQRNEFSNLKQIHEAPSEENLLSRRKITTPHAKSKGEPNNLILK